ncbi:MAG: MFS transporter [Bacteroidales bacterium]|jgi:MFS family permease|nr:MFS transporter [Bacteroidales bacterium]
MAKENKNSAVSARVKTVFRSLKYRNYRLFFSGQSVSLIGTWMQRIALPWVVYHMTGSAFLLGVVGFAAQIPTFLLAPIAGVITDRWNRYKVLLATQVLAMIQAGILAWLSLTGNLDIWHIVVLSVVMGCINSFDVPARQSFVVDMVEKKEDLGNAIALNSMMFNGARLIGPSVAGLMISITGEGICFLTNALSYLFVIASLMAMHVPDKQVKKNDNHIFMELKEGFKYTFGFSPIKHLILLLSLVSLMGMSYSVLMPVFAKEILHGGSHTYGFLMGAAGSGALLGALFLASRETVIKLGRLIPAAASLFGTGLVVLSFSSHFVVSVILMVFIGLGMMLHTAASNTILQTITDDDKRGRVMSFYTMAIMGTAPFGSLLAGSLAKIAGTPATIFVGGISCIAGALLFYKKLPELRKLVRPVYVRMGIIPEVATGIQTATEPSARRENGYK